jgi:hypothetical protein
LAKAQLFALQRRAVLAMPDDRPASVADIVVEELRKKEINGPIRLPKRDFFTRGCAYRLIATTDSN